MRLDRLDDAVCRLVRVGLILHAHRPDPVQTHGWRRELDAEPQKGGNMGSQPAFDCDAVGYTPIL